MTPLLRRVSIVFLFLQTTHTHNIHIYILCTLFPLSSIDFLLCVRARVSFCACAPARRACLCAWSFLIFSRIRCPFVCVYVCVCVRVCMCALRARTYIFAHMRCHVCVTPHARRIFCPKIYPRLFLLSLAPPPKNTHAHTHTNTMDINTVSGSRSVGDPCPEAQGRM